MCSHCCRSDQSIATTTHEFIKKIKDKKAAKFLRVLTQHKNQKKKIIKGDLTKAEIINVVMQVQPQWDEHFPDCQCWQFKSKKQQPCRMEQEGQPTPQPSMKQIQKPESQTVLHYTLSVGDNPYA